ncbi:MULTISPECIES: aminotransferase class III-fold pyridoxal phosphate-dependent enzyme [unclassified Clostridium]|uniref:aminotransferase class III-fold pyridoxal phosphate-dependent enzyme n=1 Tax=unclassified Clostridium TaxID=2614128 RepID=UPI0025B8BA26|nr:MULTISPECIES: aminotransferase class III-fold pyridoxal phosphate-dependent enzyme [unclassified Clostridium]
MSEGKCIFLSSGSEAVEFAVQIAKRIIKQPVFITLSDSYLSAYGSAGRRSSDEWYCFDWSRCHKCNNLEQCNLNCEYLNKIPIDRIGALIFEPGNASGLVKLPPEQLITTLENMVKQQGLIIIDEVITGIGRTGEWYGFEHYNIKPDIVAIGKGLGNGYPVSAVVMSQKVAENLETNGFHYAQSHQNDPLGCAIADEVINIIEDDGLLHRSYYLGIKFLEDLKKLAKKHKCIKEVRGKGLMIAVEFNDNAEKFSLESVYLQLVERGFLAGFKPVANLLRFYPPLTIKNRI